MGERRRPYSLRRRLTAAASVLFAILLAALSAGLWGYARGAADRTYDLLLYGAAIAILERIALTPSGIEVDLPPSAFEMLGLAREDRVFYRIGVAGGATLTGETDLPGLETPPRALVPGAQFRDARFNGDPIRLVTAWRVLPGGPEAHLVGAAIGQTTLARRALQLDLFLKGLVPLAALAVAGLVAVRVGVSLAMRPLVRMERDIRAREPSDLSPLTTAPPREVDALVGAINDFMRRLGASRQNAEAFIADVAHQLRTALSGLQSALEPSASTPEDRLRAARAEARRTIHLTNQLLSHAMVIHRADEAPREAVDLAALVRRTLQDTVRGGVPATVALGVETRPGAEGATVLGDPVALREALRNLVDNAVRHGPDGNEVEVRLAPARLGDLPAVELVVADRGPGIPVADKARVTDRFFVRGTKGGSGLGLAIVAAVARSHGGALELRDVPGGGLAAALVLPWPGARANPASPERIAAE